VQIENKLGTIVAWFNLTIAAGADDRLIAIHGLARDGLSTVEASHDPVTVSGNWATLCQGDSHESKENADSCVQDVATDSCRSAQGGTRTRTAITAEGF
tara:strand:+ start:31065 stop:31361 length:297 start_codon:yes stop_codon:yes gene_type:complete